METIKQLNPTLWLFAAILIFWVIVQAAMFVRLALNFNKKNNLLSDAEIKDCVKIGSTSVIGPAINAVAICLSMVGLVGSADTFMRCGVIGAPMQEMFLAQQAAAVSGVSFGTPEFTPSVMTFVLWMQVWGTIPFFVHLLISIKPLDYAANRGNTGKKAGAPNFMQFMGAAAPMALMPYFMMGYLRTKGQRECLIVALIAGIILNVVQKKTGSKFLANFSMIICMIIGMIVGELAFGTGA